MIYGHHLHLVKSFCQKTEIISYIKTKMETTFSGKVATFFKDFRKSTYVCMQLPGTYRGIFMITIFQLIFSSGQQLQMESLSPLVIRWRHGTATQQELLCVSNTLSILPSIDASHKLPFALTKNDCVLLVYVHTQVTLTVRNCVTVKPQKCNNFLTRSKCALYFRLLENPFLLE